MVLWLGRGEDNAEFGFRECLKQQFPKEVNYTIKDAMKQRSKLTSIIDEINFSEYDLIYSYGTMVSRVLKNKVKDVPIVFSIVTKPVTDGIVQSLEKPGGNVTGASNFVPIELQIKKILYLFGHKDIAIIYNPVDTQIMDFKDKMQSLVEAHGLKLKEFQFKNEYDDYKKFDKFLDSNKGKISCIYLPTDRLIVGCGQAIVQRIEEKNIPSCATNDAYLQYGAILSMTTNYYDIGWIAGEKAILILKGAEPGDIPVGSIPESKVVIKINKFALQKIGLTLPQNIEKENIVKWMQN